MLLYLFLFFFLLFFYPIFAVILVNASILLTCIDKLCLITDDGKYMNHSTDPNCLTDMETGNTFAIKNIKDGEQLFEDYRRFEHPVFLFPLLLKYECAPDYYDLPSEVQ